MSLDNANATTLGGEIDFNRDRVAQVRKIWENLKTTASMSLLRYLWGNASEAVKKAMTEKKFPSLDEMQ